LKATIEWFKIYKVPDGKPENQFAFNGEAKPRDFALHVIQEVHKHWQNLIKKETNVGNISWLVKFFFYIVNKKLFLFILNYNILFYFITNFITTT
jgi:hypothetical protein